MIKYYSWALSEKLLSLLLFGNKLYYLIGSLLNKNKKGTRVSFVSSLILVKKAVLLIPDKGTVLDVGTGWFHHESFLLWLTGNYKIILFDIRENSNLVYIKNYVGHILDNLDFLCRELNIDRKEGESKLLKILDLETKSDIYNYCNFEPFFTSDISELKKYQGKIDFMLSNCVLNHIPIKMLSDELNILKSLLKETGCMYFLIGHDDHWSFHDKSANMFNYYRYSDKYYKLFFENKFEFQNRMVKKEWDSFFKNTGLKVAEYSPFRTDESLKAIKELAKIDERFSDYSSEELSVIWSFYLLKKA